MRRGKIPGKTWHGRNSDVIRLLPKHLGERKNLTVVNLGPGLRFRPSGLIHPKGEKSSFRYAKKVARAVSDVVDALGRRLPFPMAAYATYEPFELCTRLSKQGAMALIVVDKVDMRAPLKRGNPGNAKIHFLQRDIGEARVSQPADVVFGVNIQGIEKFIANNRAQLKGAVVVCNKMPKKSEESLGLRLLEESRDRAIYKME